MNTATERTSAARAGSAKQLQLAILCLSVLLVAVDNMIINVALPTLSRTFDAGTTHLQWIVDAYTLTFAGLLLPFGYLGDRFGRRRVLQLGMVAFAAASVWAGLSPSVESLIAARAVMGVAGALIYPSTLALLTNIFTDPTSARWPSAPGRGSPDWPWLSARWPAGCCCSTTGGARCSW